MILESSIAIVGIIVAVVVALAITYWWWWCRKSMSLRDPFTQKDADVYKVVMASYQRILERNPSSKELERDRLKLQNGTTVGQLVDMLVTSDEYKRLHTLQSNDFNTELRGSVTYRQTLLELGKLYKRVFGTPKIPKEHLDFLVRKYTEYQLDDEKMTALLKSIKAADKKTTRLSPESVSNDPVLDLLNSHFPHNTGAGAKSVMETGLDQQEIQAYLQEIIAEQEGYSDIRKRSQTTDDGEHNKQSWIEEISDGVKKIGTDIRVGVGKLKLRSKDKDRRKTSTDASDADNQRRVKAQNTTLLLDAATASLASSMLPIPPPPPVCMGASSSPVNPLMEQTSLLGTLLDDVADSDRIADTNVYRTVKRSRI